MTQEIYISVDIETDGPIPGPNSMLSIGAAAFLLPSTLYGTFSVNLETLPEAQGNPETMQWWSTQPEAWSAHRTNTIPPGAAMLQFVNWVNSLPYKPVFVGYPAGFDFTFMYIYMIRFLGTSPFSFSAVDIKTYAMALLDLPYRNSSKKNMPAEWFSEKPHNHVALDDAIEQGELFCNMVTYRRKMLTIL